MSTERITQAAREYELREFASLDAGLDKINEAENVVLS